MYPVGVADGGMPSRVMSELAPITLGRDAFTCGLPDTMLAAELLCTIRKGDTIFPDQPRTALARSGVLPLALGPFSGHVVGLFMRLV